MKICKMFALIQLLDGYSKDTQTVVPVSWIHDFNLKPFRQNERDVYVVEWRNGSRMPVGGWPLFEVKVVDVDENKKNLESRVRGLDEIEDITTNAFSVGRQKDTDNYQYVFYGDSIETEMEDLDSLRNKVHNLEEENRKLREENLNLHRRISEEIPEIHRLMLLIKGESVDISGSKDSVSTSFVSVENVGASLIGEENEGTSVASIKNEDNCSNEQSVHSDDTKVELDHGSGIFIDEHAFRCAMVSTTPRAFIGTLLSSLFPINVLLNSNYKGGTPKRTSGLGETERRTALCPKTLNAIFKATLRKFPSVSKREFGVAVNARIAYLRHKSKKKSPGNAS